MTVWVSVVVPWRPGDPHREAAWVWLRPMWEALGYEVVEGHCPPDGPWRKGIAVADGARKANGQVLVVADADVWCETVNQAIARVEDGRAEWAVPHLNVRRLNETATSQLLAGEPWPALDDVHARLEKPYKGRLGGGIVVLSKHLFRACPMDGRFAGWGLEDEAWALALHTIAGRPWRGVGDLWHLWHQPQPEQVKRGHTTPQSAALFRRYRKAANSQDVAAMAALLDEGRPTEAAA